MIFKKKPCDDCAFAWDCVKNRAKHKCEAYMEWRDYMLHTRSGWLYGKWLWLKYYWRRWVDWLKSCPVVE